MDIRSVFIRIITIVLAIFTAFVIYSYIIRPYILEPMCLVDSNSCVRMSYYRYNNSALSKMGNSGLWIWFNGDKAFIYGQPVGQLCQDPSKYQTAYTINTKTGLKEGFTCVITLGEVIDFYKTKGVQLEHLITKADINNFDVYSALNTLHNNGVINLNQSN